MRLDLVRDAAVAARLPELLAERCVHSLIEQATCRRCVDACPTGAWVIDDERLGIDPDRCDGCGLCAPACPQAAIVARTAEPLRVGIWGRSGFPAAIPFAGAIGGTAMLACDRAFSGRSGFPAATADRDKNVAPTSPAGIAPCIHALGLRDLARLGASGCTRLIVATGNCDACPRGGAVRLESRLADLARLLDSRGLPILRLEWLAPDRWRAARDEAAPDPGPAIARRAFLRRGLGLAVDQAANAFGLAEAERAGVETVANLLPDTGRPGALVAVAPRIDPTTCTGCDACVSLCPQQAIELEPAALEYRILPATCTGCGICVDVCADRAVRLEAWPPAAPVDVPLAEATCARCRVRFHRPVIDLVEGHPRCPICALRRGTDRLFRVQE